jgi:hypothetical protein
LASPQVRPDLEAKATSRLQQEIEKRKGDLQKTLENQLKGLLK